MLLCLGDMMENKIILLALLVLGVVLVSGCITNQSESPLETTTTILQKLTMNDFSIIDSGWEGSYNCNFSEYGSPYIEIPCPKYTYNKLLDCEVYVNGEKSFFGGMESGLQICNGKVTIYLMEEWLDTPDGKGGWGTRLDKDVKGRVCCSYLYLNDDYLKDYEYCYTRTIPAYC